MLPTEWNGSRTSYCSVELVVDGGFKLTGVKAINYREVHEIKKIRGTSDKPIGRDRGTRDFEGDIEIYQQEWNRMLPVLTRFRAFGFAELSHLLTCTHSEISAPLDTVTDHLYGVRLHSPEVGLSEGGDLTTVKLTMSIMDIRWANLYSGLRSFF